MACPRSRVRHPAVTSCIVANSPVPPEVAKSSTRTAYATVVVSDGTTALVVLPLADNQDARSSAQIPRSPPLDASFCRHESMHIARASDPHARKCSPQPLHAGRWMQSKRSSRAPFNTPRYTAVLQGHPNTCLENRVRAIVPCSEWPPVYRRILMHLSGTSRTFGKRHNIPPAAAFRRPVLNPKNWSSTSRSADSRLTLVST
ncbi:hypothetical protein K458DRAFT_140610 [Lentithecium fluviatile CBS 122367]|uniref:Uncharacterized protein n=1 Tax=Lentithecium fluviatile CBS 122367 TaxID=1168545 RepID=A0A6G1IJA9_9PLEO|nr:hypothetical protein K458DRAFT_140610 [Lentithecium fluviatile CBS 122367]